MANERVNVSEPRFHSVARAPHDSKPIVELAHGKQPCGFTIEFAVGTRDPGPVVMRANEVGVREFPQVVRKGDLLFSRVAIPSGEYELQITVRWQPVE
jgi:hypothetical protein